MSSSVNHQSFSDQLTLIDNRTTKKLIKWGGLASIVSGICLAISYLLHPATAPPEIVASNFWILIHAGFMVSLLGGIFSLIALLAVYLSKGGKISGFLGFLMGTIGLIFIFGLDYAEVFIFPVLAVEFPAVVEKYGAGETMPSVAFAFPVAGLLFALGFLLFCYELYKTQTVARGAALLTMVGVVIFTIGLSGISPIIVVKLGSIIFGLGLVWLGRSLRSQHI